MIYCLMGIVLADEDVCTLIFDDCQTCVATQGCGWCDAGFCLSNTDNLFTCKNELTNDEKVCPESSSIRNKRQNPFCSISTSCLECNLIQGCGWCIFYPNSTNVATQTCQPITNPDLTNCPISPYTSENASFVTNCSNSGSNTNPVHSYTEKMVLLQEMVLVREMKLQKYQIHQMQLILQLMKCVYTLHVD